MTQFSTISEIPADPMAVFAHMVDLGQWNSFRGWGPLPGIEHAGLPEGETPRLGARIRVRNTDGSVHHEVIHRFEPGRLYAVQMELSPPASLLMNRIEETVELSPTTAGATRVHRRFVLVPRGAWATPLVWFIGHILLRRAVLTHNHAVRQQLSPTQP